ncbi:MAG: hypothetical protein ACTHJX_02640, partial [Terriglobales bacterium]
MEVLTLRGRAKFDRAVDEGTWLGSLLSASLGLGSLAIFALRSAAATRLGWVAGLAAACWLALIWYYLRRFKPTAQRMRYQNPAQFESYGKLFRVALLPPYFLAFLAALSIPAGRGPAPTGALILYLAFIPILAGWMLWQWRRVPRRLHDFRQLFHFGMALGAVVAVTGLIAALPL